MKKSEEEWESRTLHSKLMASAVTYCCRLQVEAPTTPASSRFRLEENERPRCARRKEYNIKSHDPLGTRLGRIIRGLRGAATVRKSGAVSFREKLSDFLLYVSYVRVHALKRNPSLPASPIILSLFPSLYFSLDLPPPFRFFGPHRPIQRAILQELNLMSSVILFVPLHLFLLLPSCFLQESKPRSIYRSRKHLNGRRLCDAK